MTAKGFVLVGSLHQGNLGDEAMLRAALARYGSPNTHILSRDIGRTDFLRLWQLFRQGHALVFIGGSLLQNVTSGRSLIYYVGLMFLAKVAGADIILEGQGWGPFRSGWAEAFALRALRWTTRVEIRDAVAFERLRDYGLKHLTLGVDPAFRMPVKIVPYQTIKRSVGFVLRPHASLDAKAEAVLLEFCRSLASRWQKKLVFVCLALPEDETITRRFVDQLHAENISATLILPHSLEEALQALAQIELLFSMRYHGCVFSEWLQGMYIGLSYDPKVAHHCALYRRPFLDMQSLSLDHLHYLWGQMNLQHELVTP